MKNPKWICWQRMMLLLKKLILIIQKVSVFFSCLRSPFLVGMRPSWGESKADQERKKKEKLEYDEGLHASLPPDEEQPPSSSSSSSSSSVDLLGDDEDDTATDTLKDFIPSTPATLPQAKVAADNKEIKQAEITITPTTSRKLTPPPPNRSTTPPRTGAGAPPPPRSVSGRPSVGGKQPRGSSRIATPPPPVTTVRPLHKPAVTPDQYALQIHVRSPNREDDVSDDFRDKVENARCRASRIDTLPLWVTSFCSMSR